MEALFPSLSITAQRGIVSSQFIELGLFEVYFLCEHDLCRPQFDEILSFRFDLLTERVTRAFHFRNLPLLLRDDQGIGRDHLILLLPLSFPPDLSQLPLVFLKLLEPKSALRLFAILSWVLLSPLLGMALLSLEPVGDFSLCLAVRSEGLNSQPRSKSRVSARLASSDGDLSLHSSREIFALPQVGYTRPLSFLFIASILTLLTQDRTVRFGHLGASDALAPTPQLEAAFFGDDGGGRSFAA